jgi:hypothetical protein
VPEVSKYSIQIGANEYYRHLQARCPMLPLPHPATVAVYHLGNNGTARKLWNEWLVTIS